MTNSGISLGVCRIKWVTPKAVKVVTKDYGELWDKLDSEGNFVVCNWYAVKEKLI